MSPSYSLNRAPPASIIRLARVLRSPSILASSPCAKTAIVGMPASRAARWQKLSMPCASPETTTAFVGLSEPTSRLQSSSALADGRRVPTMAMPILSLEGREPLQKSCLGLYLDARKASG